MIERTNRKMNYFSKAAAAGLLTASVFVAGCGQVHIGTIDRARVQEEAPAIKAVVAEANTKLMEAQSEAQGQLTDEQRMQLNNQLAQQYLSEYALEKVSGAIGLSVSDDELYALLVGKGISPSPLASQFFGTTDEKQVNEFIRQLSDKQIQAAPQDQRQQLRAMQSQFTLLQEQIRTQRLQQKLGTLLSRTYKLNDLDRELALGNETRTVALVRTSSAMIASRLYG